MVSVRIVALLAGLLGAPEMVSAAPARNTPDSSSELPSRVVREEDGPGPALDVLGPIWPSTQITVLGTTFDSPMSWLHYRNSMSGEIVDRSRWDAGCIAEHVSNSPRGLLPRAVVPETNERHGVKC